LEGAKMLTTFSWVGVPAVWMRLAYFGLISHSAEELLYEMFDFIIKSGVSCIIMHSSLKTHAEKKEERMRAELAEERGTIRALRETARMKVNVLILCFVFCRTLLCLLSPAVHNYLCLVFCRTQHGALVSEDGLAPPHPFKFFCKPNPPLSCRRTSLQPCRTSCARPSSASSASPMASSPAGPRSLSGPISRLVRHLGVKRGKASHPCSVKERG
jgi:hypothetical protein